MKFVKRISLFVIFPVVMFSLGFYSNIKFQEFFYPNHYEPIGFEKEAEKEKLPVKTSQKAEPQVIPAAVESEQIITADTAYIIEEVDLEKDTAVETKWKVPDKYIGMNRVAFLKEMELYQASPSLTDQELGLVSVEVVSFSGERILVRKNYIYKKTTSCFYLVNEKNVVVVYCDDMKTIFMQTNISLDSLPDQLKQEIIQTKLIQTEEELYNFLESYSS